MKRSTGTPSTIPRASLTVAALSTVVEWYDFTLYLYFATVLSRVFFGSGETSLPIALGGFAVAYLMRPLGALVFGHYGDRQGRRRMLLGSVALMTAAMLATALLPTRAQIGASAGGWLILLRCVMGFAVGGEYTGVVAYLLEGARPARRGLVVSMAAAASEVGALFAVGAAAWTVRTFDPTALLAWGWRVPFLVGAALAATLWLARSTMHESPDFTRQQAAGTVPARPLAYTWRHHRKGVLRAFAISALGSMTYYVGITYVPVFLTSTGALGEGEALGLSTWAAIAVIVVTPLTGLLADRMGRRPVLVALGLCSALLPVGLFGAMAHGSRPTIALASLALACVAGGVSAVGAVATAEQFPGEGRLSGLALGATVATAVFGGLSPFVAQVLIDATGWPMVPGWMIAAVALAVLPLLLGLPETAPARRGKLP